MRSLIADRARRLGYGILDATSRSWGAFWGTILACAAYAAWNSLTKRPFDPYPFIFLTLIITLFSYLQNIVIMTDQRENAKAQARQEELQRSQLKYMLHTMEAIRAHLTQAAAPTGLVRGQDPAPSNGGVEIVEEVTARDQIT